MFQFAQVPYRFSAFAEQASEGAGLTRLMWLQIGSDLFIGLACLSLTSMFVYLTRQRTGPFQRLLWVGAVFFLACGSLFLVEAALLQYSNSYFAAALKIAAALASWVTIFTMIPLIPQIMEPLSASTRPYSVRELSDTTLHRLAAPNTWSRGSDYLIAVLVAVLTLTCRAVLARAIENDYLYVLQLLGVVFVSWRSGFGPGIANLLVCGIGMYFIFLRSRHTGHELKFGDLLATAMFFFCGACCAALGEAQWAARRRAKAALHVALERKAELEVEVARRREAETALREREAQLTDFFENANVGLHWGAQDGTILRANRAELDMLGYSSEEYVGRPISSFHMDRQTIDAIYARLKSGDRVDNCPARLRCKDGSHRDVLISSTVLWEEGRFRHTRSFTRDVTEHKRAEQKLRASEARYRTLTEAIPQLVWNATPDGRASYFNTRWRDYTGLSAEDSQGWGWLEVIHPAQADEFRRRWRLAVAQEAPEFSAEFQLRRGSDGSYRWMLANAISLRDSAGAIDEWVGSMADIDDQKRQAENLERMVHERTTALLEEVEERKRVEQQLRAVGTELSRSNRELEQFAYVASHDLQEPLRKIQAFGDRLRTRFSESLPEAGKEYVERMHVSASRMRRLIDDLLTFSRVTTLARPFAKVNLEKLVNEVVSDLDETIDQTGARVECRNLPTIDADPSQMRQLFQNMLTNAIKFHRPNCPPAIIVEAELTESQFPHTNGRTIPACRVSVRDNGIGFNEKYLDRIFQVFQRLHGRDEYEGTGVGLAICRKITERHGGLITAQSKTGEGSTFIITLPRHQTEEEQSSHARIEQETDHHPDGR